MEIFAAGFSANYGSPDQKLTILLPPGRSR